jgi:hypothetical protein
MISPNDRTCWPAISLLFVIFALGALFDPARPPFSIESQEYYLLSRVSHINFAEPIFKTTSTAVITLVCVWPQCEFCYVPIA